MPTFELICLANSKKHGGRCVAGLRTDGGGWIRLVGPSGGVLLPSHYRFDSGSTTRVLDVVRVGCAGAHPKPHHPEDWMIDGTPWKLVARPAGSKQLEVLQQHLTRQSMLLQNWGDRVPYDSYCIRPAASSLALVAPEKIEWAVRLNEHGARRMRVLFTLNGRSYDLPLTDPQWEQRVNRLSPGTHPRNDVADLKPEDELLLTISLGEPFQVDVIHDEYCFKLVAGVVVLPPRDLYRAIRRPVFAVVRARATDAEQADLSDYPDPFPSFSDDSER
jgi:hypothetical protein